MVITATGEAQSKQEFLVVSDVDSHAQCRMAVTVESGKLVGVRGVPSDPESKGELSAREEHILEFVYAPDRLRYPMKRVGARGEDKWERISWDEALDTIAQLLLAIRARLGAEAVDFHHGHYHSGEIFGVYLSRLANLFGSPNVTNPSHICLLPRAFLQFYIDFGAVVPPDIAHTSCLILWGGNPKASNKAQEIAIREARARGAKLIVIDPRRTGFAGDADIHVQLRPGTDGALALALLNVIISEQLYDKEFVEHWTKGFDELARHVQDYSPEKAAEITWVSADTIRAVARTYATSKPACISPRNALDEHTNASCAIRAIDLLMAITGNIDVRGGNMIQIPVFTGIEDLRLTERLPPEQRGKRLGLDRSLIARLSNAYPSAHTPALWDAIVDREPYAVEAMLVFSANPIVSEANAKRVQAALAALDFLVVVDLFMTPTAKQADIVLPACSFFEKSRFTIYDAHSDHGWNVPGRVVLSPKVIEPLHESWSDWKIICELGRRLGYGEHFAWKTEEDSIDDTLRPLGIDCAALREHPDGIQIHIPGFLHQKLTGRLGAIERDLLAHTLFRHYPDMDKKYAGFMKGFNTPSRKVELYSERLRDLGYDPLPTYREPAESPLSQPELAREFPFVLIGGSKMAMYTHSMMRNVASLRSMAPGAVAEIHPSTAQRLGIADADRIKVSTLRGSVESLAQLTDRIDPRVIHVSFGFADTNANVLTDHKACDPITGSTGLKSCLCKVERVAA
jgi:formate dehydrogenase (coenzyme F420) alpha subunit